MKHESPSKRLESLLRSKLLPGLLLAFFTTSCGGAQTIIAQGEAFQELTVVTENLKSSYYPALSPDGQTIVFVSEKDGNADLFMKTSITGAAVQKLTTHGAADLMPTFSPDGKHVAFSTMRSGNFDIFMLSLDGGVAKRQVTDSPEDELFPSWSPDGTQIAYARYSSVDGNFYIWTRNLETNANVQLGPGTMPKFSPDGEKILFQKSEKTGENWYTLWTMDRAGGSQTQLTSGSDWGAIQATWSPDGEKIIFVTSKGQDAQIMQIKGRQDFIEAHAAAEGSNLWVMNSDGGALTQLTTHVAEDFYPVWASTNHVYFASTRDEELRIWRMVPVLTDGYIPSTAGSEEASEEESSPDTEMSGESSVDEEVSEDGLDSVLGAETPESAGDE